VNADTLREKFLQFFKSRRHRIVESDSLVPKDDPTVLFTPAGMNQFKKEFMGFDSGFKRAATSQRCLRTDDLEKVGKTPSHHTFFEMLGNFSFGDYFKKEAIAWAWEFLTEELKIDKERLWVSVYQGDEEAYKIWRENIGVPARKILKLGDKDNFWPAEAKAKGPNGPCGPCSEIFYDFGKGVGCKESVCDPTCDCGRFTEVWNLVFTQFNRKDRGLLEPLPKKNIDTGMGLERLSAVMQGAENNFQTELFKPIIKEIVSSVKCQVSSEKQLLYAVADHIRAIVFAIYDGVLPSNDGRGYVVRKIIRKSALHLKELGIRQAFLYKLVPVVAEVMKRPYPELKKRQEDISQVVLAEEKSFLDTINTTAILFREKFKPGLSPEEAGRIAFLLYDTYGIPWELTKDWLDKQKIVVSQAAFNQELSAQKSRSKMQSSMQGEVFSAAGLHLDLPETKFLGYRRSSCPAKIIKIIRGAETLKKISQGEGAALVLDKTSFYAESGGQVADTGLIAKNKNVFEVSDTKKLGKAIIHIGVVKEGSFKLADAVEARVDTRRRLDIARNHTATHLLQAALRKVLGEHVRQQGSLVAPERLRFDFTHFKDVSPEELNRIEEAVNNYILEDVDLSVKEMPLAAAKKSGALAFFAEKYAGKVRVVAVADFSRELCGGTHLESTGQIGVFKIIQEGSVASGIRRIEAITGRAAHEKIKEEKGIIQDIAEELGVPPENLLPELQKRLNRIKELEKELDRQKMNIARNSADALAQNCEVINGIKFISTVIERADMDFLRKSADMLKSKTDNAVIALGGKEEGRAILVMAVAPILAQKGLRASQLIREPAQILGGSGGGRDDFAQAGGNLPQNFPRAFEALKEEIKKL
jgi:alanyl-tRNA synthetase